MKMNILQATAVLLLFVACGSAQTNSLKISEADRTAITQTALDYIEGWYTADAARMERALHPDLAKRIVQTNQQGQSRLGQMTATALVEGVKRGGGKDTPKEKQLKEVTILDVYENAASVKIVASEWIDYLHLARYNGRWVIVNVLWELKPQPPKSTGAIQDALKSQLETLYAGRNRALMKNDFPAYVDNFSPDYSIKLLNGQSLTRAEVEDFIKNDMSRTLSVKRSKSEIQNFTVRGDEVSVVVTHESSRVLIDAEGRPRQWDSKVVHRETWFRTPKGWKIKTLEEMEQIYLKRDGQPIN